MLSCLCSCLFLDIFAFLSSHLASHIHTNDHQGVRQIKQTQLNPVYLFISPPTLSQLRNRLRGRGTETETTLAKRLSTALKEVEYAKTGAHELVIVNDDLDRAYALFEKVALGEKIEGDRLPPLDDEEN